MIKSMGWVSLLIAGSIVSGCADTGTTVKEENVEMGTLALPLTSTSPAGVQYRLRNATFEIQQPYYYCYDYGAAGAYQGVGGSASGCAEPIIVNSETDPTAASIAVELEAGSYEIELLPGWTMERIEGGVATPVEAQLLSDPWQWVYVSRHATSWVEYQFGIGDRAMWFNGQLNIEIQTYDDPEQYYGPSYGGYGGIGGFSGMPATAGAAWASGGASF